MEPSNDDKEWDRVLSDPANIATMEVIAIELKAAALSGALGAPEIFIVEDGEVKS